MISAYFVESNKTGKRDVCTLTRGTWNKVDTGAFFSYEHTAIVVKKAEKCDCGNWAMYPSKFGTQEEYEVFCENCTPKDN